MKKKIVFLGNSIVNGFPHKRSQCFVSLFREATGNEVINKGVNGETSPEALARLSSDVISHKPDCMVFLGGTNDFIFGICTPEETLAYYRQIAGAVRENGIEPVFLIPLLVDPGMADVSWIPGKDYNMVRDNLLRLKTLLFEFGEKEGIRVIDTQTFFRNLYTEETKTDYLRDGLHPTVLGHEKLAGFLVSQL